MIGGAEVVVGRGTIGLVEVDAVGPAAELLSAAGVAAPAAAAAAAAEVGLSVSVLCLPVAPGVDDSGKRVAGRSGGLGTPAKPCTGLGCRTLPVRSMMLTRLPAAVVVHVSPPVDVDAAAVVVVAGAAVVVAAAVDAGVVVGTVSGTFTELEAGT